MSKADQIISRLESSAWRYEDDPMDTGWRDRPPDSAGLFRAVRRQTPLVLLFMLAGLLAALAFLLYAPPLYTARAALFLDPAQDAPPAPDALAADLDTHVALLRSDETTAAVIDRLDLSARPEFATGPGLLRQAVEDLRGRLDMPALPHQAEPADPRPAVIRKVREGLDVGRVGNARVIELRYTAPTPALAAKIADAFAETYLDTLAANGRQAALARIARLEARAAESEQKALSADARLRGMLAGSEHLTADPRELERQAAALRQRLFGIEARAAALSARLSRTAGAELTGDPAGLTTGTPSGEPSLDDLVVAQAQLPGLRQPAGAAENGAENGARLPEGLGREARLAAGEIESDLRTTLAERAQVLDRIARLREHLGSAAWAELQAAQRDRDVHEALHREHLARLEQARGAAEPPPVLRAAGPALAPASPSFPDDAVTIALALALAAALGIGVAALREWSRG